MNRSNFPVEKFRLLRTPFYYYDTELLRQTLEEIKRGTAKHPDFKVHYAIKANANPEILKIISDAGFGADCVSGGEIRAAIRNGFKPENIVFAGVGKSDWEIDLALNYGIEAFNVESEAELDVLSQMAAAKGKTANICLRVNPDVGAHTHSNITTGLAENKFGINKDTLESVMRKAKSLPYINLKGLHFHIGSQILDMMDFVALCNRVNELMEILDAAGLKPSEINVGGGLGIDYYHPNSRPIPDFESYFEVFANHLNEFKGRVVHFELGRSVVAQCGSLISKVLYVKEGSFKKFVILDAGMNDLIRPAMYHAYHKVENITSSLPEQTYDVVGPVCESSDTFCKETQLPETVRGDLCALRSAGAYGETMCMQYNCRPLPEAYFDYQLK